MQNTTTDWDMDDGDARDPMQDYDGRRFYCCVCRQNEVAALDGEDTCGECLRNV